jgi:hypothetical protein
MARSSETKFLIIAIPLLLLTIVVILAQPLFLPETLKVSLSAVDDTSLPLGQINLPPGFSIDVYARGVTGAREMALSPNGTLFIGSIAGGKVYAVLDDNRDGQADEVIAIASGLHMPNGVAWRNGSLYVAEISRILRYDDIDRHLADPPKPVVINSSYPSNEWHGWKYIAFGPDGKLYVPVGAPCNICDSPPPFASITRLDANGTGFEIYARGIRNTVGFDWDPLTGELWFTDNRRDYLGNDLPPDELDHAPHAGMDFGFPYVHGRNITDPEFGKGHSPA